MSEATVPGALGHCDGSRAWLGPYTKEECDEPNRLLVRHASNAYFPQIMSVISLPDRNETLEKAGGSFSKIPAQEVTNSFQHAEQEASEVLDRQRIPADAADITKGYFQRLGGQK